MALAQYRHADVVEDRRDGSVRFVDRYAYRSHMRESGKNGVGDLRCCGLHEPEVPPGEGTRRGLDDRTVGSGVGKLVAPSRRAKIDGNFKIDHEALAHRLLVGHDPVMGVNEKSVDENAVGHARSSIAAMTR